MSSTEIGSENPPGCRMRRRMRFSCNRLYVNSSAWGLSAIVINFMSTGQTRTWETCRSGPGCETLSVDSLIQNPNDNLRPRNTSKILCNRRNESGKLQDHWKTFE